MTREFPMLLQTWLKSSATETRWRVFYPVLRSMKLLFSTGWKLTRVQENTLYSPTSAGPLSRLSLSLFPAMLNSRLADRGIPVACEVDIYGALSEYIGTCVSQDTVTLLDINNSVPADIYDEEIKGKFNYTHKDTFMGFHCGNTARSKLSFGEMKYQLIMHRGLEPDVEPDITRGTLEGDIVPGNITFFRLQSTADAQLRAYIAEGEVLPVATRSFGCYRYFRYPRNGKILPSRSYRAQLSSSWRCRFR